jgi:hypothetical protein
VNVARWELAGWLTQTKRRGVIALIVFIGAGIPLYLGIKAADWVSDPALLPSGALAPNLAGRTLEGGSFDGIYGGRVRVYVFVDPLLTSAAEQGEAIQAWNERWTDGRVLVMAILLGQDEARQRKWVTRYRLNPARVVLDREGVLTARFHLDYPPAVYVLDGLNFVRFAAKKAVRPDSRELIKAVEEYQVEPTRRLTRDLP